MIVIAQMPTELVPKAWPAIGPLLALGSKDGKSLHDHLDDLENDKARLWVIVDEDGPLAVFLTSVFSREADRVLDVYALGGKRILSFGKRLAREMCTYARANDCTVIRFNGRRALLRAYKGIRPFSIVGKGHDGLYQFEGAIH